MNSVLNPLTMSKVLCNFLIFLEKPLLFFGNVDTIDKHNFQISKLYLQYISAGLNESAKWGLPA